jgi:hypothetical protein
MAELTDLKKAYLIGIRDGFRLARADETAPIEDLIAEIQNDIDVKMGPCRPNFARIWNKWLSAASPKVMARP